MEVHQKTEMREIRLSHSEPVGENTLSDGRTRTTAQFYEGEREKGAIVIQMSSSQDTEGGRREASIFCCSFLRVLGFSLRFRVHEFEVFAQYKETSVPFIQSESCVILEPAASILNLLRS